MRLSVIYVDDSEIHCDDQRRAFLKVNALAFCSFIAACKCAYVDPVHLPPLLQLYDPPAPPANMYLRLPSIRCKIVTICRYSLNMLEELKQLVMAGGCPLPAIRLLSSSLFPTSCCGIIR
jgi:hypothetical protein